MTRVERREAEVDRKTRGVGGVHSVSALTAARVVAREVEARAVLQSAVMATWPATCATLVHILAMSPISLKNESVNKRFFILIFSERTERTEAG